MRTVRVRAVTVRIRTVGGAHQFRGRLHGIDAAADDRRWWLDGLDRRWWLCLLLVMVRSIIIMMVVVVVVLRLLMVIMMMILVVLVHVVGLRLAQRLHVVVNHWDTGQSGLAIVGIPPERGKERE